MSEIVYTHLLNRSQFIQNLHHDRGTKVAVIEQSNDRCIITTDLLVKNPTVQAGSVHVNDLVPIKD